MTTKSKLVSLVSNWSHETNDTTRKLVSLVSHSFRSDTNDTNRDSLKRETQNFFVAYPATPAQLDIMHLHNVSVPTIPGNSEEQCEHERF